MKKLTSIVLSLFFAMSMFFATPFKAEAATFKNYDFSQMTFDYTRGTEYTLSGKSVNLSFGGKYKEIQFLSVSYTHLEYVLKNEGIPIMKIYKEWMTLGDSYVLDIDREEDELLSLAIVLAVDCEICSRNN